VAVRKSEHPAIVIEKKVDRGRGKKGGYGVRVVRTVNEVERLEKVKKNKSKTQKNTKKGLKKIQADHKRERETGRRGPERARTGGVTI